MKTIFCSMTWPLKWKLITSLIYITTALTLLHLVIESFPEWHLKLVPAIFYQTFISTEWYPFKNYEKCYLFHLKSSFRSRNIQIFVFPFSPLFLPVSQCFRGWSKINLVYDGINCLNKNLVTQFCLIFWEGKRHDIETLSIDRLLNKEHFHGNIMQKIIIKR